MLYLQCKEQRVPKEKIMTVKELKKLVNEDVLTDQMIKMALASVNHIIVSVCDEPKELMNGRVLFEVSKEDGNTDNDFSDAFKKYVRDPEFEALFANLISDDCNIVCLMQNVMDVIHTTWFFKTSGKDNVACVGKTPDGKVKVFNGKKKVC